LVVSQLKIKETKLNKNEITLIQAWHDKVRIAAKAHCHAMLE
jgi:hypothetical protein